jgi:hypothetical protein
MRLEGEDMAFRVGVRGYRRNNLQELFIPNFRYWRDNLIFQFMPDEINRITVLHAREDSRSFHLVRNEEGAFRIAAGSIPGSWSVPQPEKLDQYLGYFYEVRFESFLDPATDTLQYRPQPDYKIQVESIHGIRADLELFPIHSVNSKGEWQHDFNRLYGKIGKEKGWIVIKYVQIDPLLQDFEYFK